MRGRLQWPLGILTSLLLLSSCSRAGGPDDPSDRPETGEQSSGRSAREARLVDRVWRVVEPTSRAPGSIYVFLADGTVLMTSCVETYRLAPWRWDPDGHLLVTEDPAVSYKIALLGSEDRDLRLRLELAGESVELELRAAAAPFVCPDLPRGP